MVLGLTSKPKLISVTKPMPKPFRPMRQIMPRHVLACTLWYRQYVIVACE